MMNDFSVVIFLVVSLSLLGGALWLMWSAGTSEPMKNYRTGTWTTKLYAPQMKEGAIESSVVY